MKRIPFVKPWINKKELFSAVNSVDLNNIGSSGPNSKSLEKYFEKKLKVHRAMLVGSCTQALEISLLSLGLKQDDEVICPSYTFVSTVNSIVKAGAKAVFVDIEPETLGLDPALVEKAITNKTKAIVLVHYGGLSAKVKKIKTICEQYKIKLIEDAAQVLFVKHEHQYLGTFGSLGCFSFHYTKNATSGEGGLLVVPNDDNLINVCEEIKSFGTNRGAFLRGEVEKYEWQRIGGSYFMTEFQAALLKSQMKKYSKILTERKRICRTYSDLLRALEGKQVGVSKHSMNSNFHLFWIICRSRKERCELLQMLNTKGVTATSHFEPLHLSPFVTNNPDKFRIKGDMGTTIMISERILRLPLYPELTNKEIKFICSIILNYYQTSVNN